MTPAKPAHPGDHVVLMAGDCRFSAEPRVLVTILGSCVSVCLWDQQRGIGGMNHFVLPTDYGRHGSARYGDVAINELQTGLLHLGSQLADLQAKLFGGAAVLPYAGYSVGLQNVTFAMKRLSRDGIPVIAQRTGGTLGQQIKFNTRTGDVLFRHLRPADLEQ